MILILLPLTELKQIFEQEGNDQLGASSCLTLDRICYLKE